MGRKILTGQLPPSHRTSDVLALVQTSLPVPPLPTHASSNLSSLQVRAAKSRRAAKASPGYDPKWSSPSSAFPLYPLEARSLTASSRTFLSETHFVLAQAAQ